MRSDSPQCSIRAHVVPRSSWTRAEILPDGSLRLWVMASATDGQANEAACRLLAERLGVAKSAISIASGMKSRRKRFLVEGLSTTDVMLRLAGV